MALFNDDELYERLNRVERKYDALRERQAALYEYLNLEFVPSHPTVIPALVRKRERPPERPTPDEFTDERPRPGRPSKKE